MITAASTHLLVVVVTIAVVRAVDRPRRYCRFCQRPATRVALLPRPEAIVAWFHCHAARKWRRKSHGDGSIRETGRPRTKTEVEDFVRMIKVDNPGYGGEKIARMVAHQFDHKIHPDTVRNILRRRPSPNPEPTRAQSYWTFLRNHTHSMASMDFKVVHDWLGRQVFILNILHHGRRQLLRCRATRHPTQAWITQQLREAFPFEHAPHYMLFDRDPHFNHAAAHILPNMGIRPIRTSHKAPWQNPYVERFIHTLSCDLLNHVVVFTESQLNQRLREYQAFYNTARPHGANAGEPPIPPEAVSNDNEPQVAKRLKIVEWCGGLHRSYRWEAA